LDLNLNLNFYETMFNDCLFQLLMEKLCSDLYPEIPALENPALITSLVTSLGQMRYKHKGSIS